MAVTVYIASKTGAPDKILIPNAVKISPALNESRVIVVLDSGGNYAAMFTAESILGVVLEPPALPLERREDSRHREFSMLGVDGG